MINVDKHRDADDKLMMTIMILRMTALRTALMATTTTTIMMMTAKMIMRSQLLLLLLFNLM